MYNGLARWKSVCTRKKFILKISNIRVGRQRIIWSLLDLKVELESENKEGSQTYYLPT